MSRGLLLVIIVDAVAVVVVVDVVGRSCVLWMSMLIS